MTSAARVISLLSLIFFSFILWIIYLANTGQSSIFFRLIATIPYGDKVGHFCLFGLLSLGANVLFKLKSYRIAKFNIYAGSIFVLSFALIEELSQYFIPSRTLDIFDLLADLSGVVIFHFITKGLSKFYK